MTVQDIEIVNIVEHPDAQPRVQMDLFVSDDYALQMAEGANFPPITVFKNGTGEYYLADGFHRVRAARKNEYITIKADVREGGLRDAVLFSVGANAAHGLRRTNEDKARAVKIMLKDPEWQKWSDREIARRCGVTHPYVATIRSLVTVTSDNGKHYKDRWGNTTIMDTRKIGKPSVSERIVPEAREFLSTTPLVDAAPDQIKRIAGMEPEKQVEIAARINAGAPNVQKAWRAIKDEQVEEARAKLPDVTDRYRLVCSGIETIHEHIEPGSIDVIITDPPYPVEYLPLYPVLSEQAARLLKPGGLLVAMVGKKHLPEFISRLSAHMDYHWTAPFMMTQTARVWDRHVYTGWKPLLIFSNGEYTGDFFNDVIESQEPPDKSLHNWQQSLPGMIEIVRRFTRPGFSVLDPFCGAGTTGAAALICDCYFIGSDVEQSAIDKTKLTIEQSVEMVHP